MLKVQFTAEMAGLDGVALLRLVEMVRVKVFSETETVQIRDSYGQIHHWDLLYLYQLLTTGINRHSCIENADGTREYVLDYVQMMEVSHIQKVSFDFEYRIRPVVSTEDIDASTQSILEALSSDYVENFNKTTFWYLQHISTGAIACVVRHDWLMDCIRDFREQKINQ